MDSIRVWAGFAAIAGWRYLLALIYVLLAPSGLSSPTDWASFIPGGRNRYQEAPRYQEAGETPAATNSPSMTPIATTSTTPIVTVTPAADGSIVHVVEPGQVLITIAAAYRVSLSRIYALNGLTADLVIYPGDKIIIRPATITPSATTTETALPTTTPLPAPTHRPTRTATQLASATPVLEAQATALPGATQSVFPAQVQTSSSDPLLIVIIILAIIGAGLVVVGNLLKRRA